MKIAAMEEVAAVALAVGVELANDILAHTVDFIDAVAPARQAPCSVISKKGLDRN